MFKPHRSGSAAGSQARLYDDETRACIAKVVELRRLGFTVTEIARGDITPRQYEDQLLSAQERHAELEQVIVLLKNHLSEVKTRGQEIATARVR